jgi:hypothetical protein
VSFTDAELEAAIAALSEPGRLSAAQDLVSRAAPNLQTLLAGALLEGGWFDTAHDAAVRDALAIDEPELRRTAIRTLFAEETRLSMLVGVAVGFELSRELRYPETAPDNATDRKDQ